jgi:hypothetical protein
MYLMRYSDDGCMFGILFVARVALLCVATFGVGDAHVGTLYMCVMIRCRPFATAVCWTHSFSRFYKC